MTVITGPGVYTLPKPFDFDILSETLANGLGRKFSGDASLLLHCLKPVGVQPISITLWKIAGWEKSLSRSCNALDRDYVDMRLAPNPWHLIAFAIIQPDFADQRAIATQWKDANGNFYYAGFESWYGGGRNLNIGKCDGDWFDDSLLSGTSIETVS